MTIKAVTNGLMHANLGTATGGLQANPRAAPILNTVRARPKTHSSISEVYKLKL